MWLKNQIPTKGVASVNQTYLFSIGGNGQHASAGVSVRDIIADRIFGLLIWFASSAVNERSLTRFAISSLPSQKMGVLYSN
jgi:hypothetical protein